jgi:hypothetical protein
MNAQAHPVSREIKCSHGTALANFVAEIKSLKPIVECFSLYRRANSLGYLIGGNVTIRRSFVVGGQILAERPDASPQSSAFADAGGFFGWLQNANVVVEDSFVNVSTVKSFTAVGGNTAFSSVGGFVGYSDNTALTIRRSYMRGTTEADARSNIWPFGSNTTRHGALVGRRENGGSVTATNNAFRIGTGGPSKQNSLALTTERL